ncbi:MAG TPA: D-aminoacyl-tRNA deacylase [Steroidobacteraceae bacterium]|nr:D-aminoacyl-tRNA deacylase [Steroidobacteraceae bacterium]
MIALIQRVSEASITIYGEKVGSIGRGVVALMAVEPGDTEATARKLVDRVLAYRVFDDANGRMNLSVTDAGGELLLVPQFTLAADTRKGLRPSFTSAAPPALGRELFERAVARARASLPGRVATGRFGANMKIALVNDGPVTFWLQIPTPAATE